MSEVSRWLDEDAADLIGSRDERAALFDYLVAATERRQAISSAKQKLFGTEPARDMGRFRTDLVEARTPADVWYALVRLSNVRHDRHLSVRPVENGLPIPKPVFDTMVFNYAELEKSPAHRAPATLATDFSDPAQPRIFLAAGPHSPGVLPGDWLVSVNGEPVSDYIDRVEPYFCYSTPTFFQYHLPREITRRSALLPAQFYRDELTLGFLGRDGVTRQMTLPYLPPAKAPPFRQDDPYRGFVPAITCASYDLLLPEGGEKLLLLDWHGFDKYKLVGDVDRLMAWCAGRGLLDAGIIFDATRCRGGDYGGYLLQRLSDKPCRINFGDLRLSDAIPQVITDVLAEDAADRGRDGLSPGQLKAMDWRRDWLETDVRAQLAQGLAETRPVPFKCAHQPKDGDGWLQPAARHFSGPLVVLTMPFGGSHIDQVVAQLHDNGLCTQIGMPLGGFSKTYTHEETLTLPSGVPLARFMWSCGNTIRPNGEVLEANPAQPHEALPQTRDNFAGHHRLLVERGIAMLNRPVRSDGSQGTAR